MSPHKVSMLGHCLLLALAVGCGGATPAADAGAGGAGGGGGGGAGGGLGGPAASLDTGYCFCSANLSWVCDRGAS